MLGRVLALLGLSLISAQALADAYEITDSFGKHWFEQVPERVVVTDWTILDNLLRLNVVPVGAPETARYRTLPDQPTLPASVNDIGLRVAPSPARIRALEPDLIIIGTGQKELARPLSHIAKVIYFKNFSDRYRTNGRKARERWLQMAAVFQKTAQAQAALQAMDERMAELAGALNPDQTVVLLQATPQGQLRLFGDNSLPGHVLRTLGLTPGLIRPATHWGESPLTLDDLGALNTTPQVLLFAPQSQHAQWKNAIEKQDLSAGIQILPRLWPYGGALSLLQIAERIRHALR